MTCVNRIRGWEDFDIKITPPPKGDEVKLHYSVELIFIILKREVIQLFEVEELGEGHIQRACNLVEVHDSGIAGSAVDDIVDGRLAHVAHLGELVDRDPTLLAQAADAVRVYFTICHIKNSHTIIVTQIRLIQ